MRTGCEEKCLSPNCIFTLIWRTYYFSSVNKIIKSMSSHHQWSSTAKLSMNERLEYYRILQLCKFLEIFISSYVVILQELR